MSENDSGAFCIVIMNQGTEGHGLDIDCLVANASTATEEHKTVLPQMSEWGGSLSLILNFPLL